MAENHIEHGSITDRNVEDRAGRGHETDDDADGADAADGAK